MVKKRKRDGGFTLIELMIVIAVIGILAVVLVPKMAGIKTSAKNVGVETNVKSVQAYIVANIDKWVNQNKNETQISDEIYDQFTLTNNQLKNPFSGSLTISGNIGTSGKALKTPNADDALKIVDSSLDNTDSAHGSVVISIPSSYKTSGIQVAGYDINGKLIDEIITIQH